MTLLLTAHDPVQLSTNDHVLEQMLTKLKLSLYVQSTFQH